jgi:hypothetical protein
MNILTTEAVKYVTLAVGDLETYICTKIEADVKLSKIQ